MKSLCAPAILGVLAALICGCGDDDSQGVADASAMQPEGDGDSAGDGDGDGSVATGDGDGDDAVVGAKLTWTAGAISGPDSEKVGAFRAMAFGGGRFVAFAVAFAANKDSNYFALVSDDGKTWRVSQKFALNYGITSVAYYGSTFVWVGVRGDAEGNSKAFYATSPDGSAWTFLDAPGVGTTNAIAANSEHAVWGGDDGLTTSYVTGQTPQLHSAAPLSVTVHALCSVGSRFIATGQLRESAAAGQPLFLYTDDPTNNMAWKAAQEPNVVTRVGSVFRGIYCDDQLQVAVGAGKDVFVSTDVGASWISAVSEGDSTTWTSIQKAANKLVIVGWKGAYGVMTNASDLAVGNIGVPRDFAVSASNGSIVVAGSGGGWNDNTPGVLYWTAP